MPDTMAQRLAGKVALLTVAAGGIGLAAARWLAEEGCCVLLADIDDATELNDRKVTAEIAVLPTRMSAIGSFQPRSRAGGVSISSTITPAIMARALPSSSSQARSGDGFSQPTCWLPPGSPAPQRPPWSRAEPDRIINGGRVQASLPLLTDLADVSRMDDVAMLTRAVAPDVSPSGIPVNAVVRDEVAIAPTRATIADTPITAPADSGEPNVALLRWTGRAEEFDAAIAFLAANDAAFVTGAMLSVDAARRLPDPFGGTLCDYSIGVSG